MICGLTRYYTFHRDARDNRWVLTGGIAFIEVHWLTGWTIHALPALIEHFPQHANRNLYKL